MTTRAPIFDALARLPGWRTVRDGQYKACCPAHDDHDPSLDISIGADGRVLLTCRSQGCTAEAIVAALGYQMRDLFAPHPDDAKRTGRAETHRYPAFDAGTGKRVGVHVRKDTWDANGVKLPKTVWWEPKGIKLPPLALYGIAELHQAKANGGKRLSAIVLEGERKRDDLNAALVKAGRRDLVAVGTMTGSGVTPCDAALGALAGCDVVLWPDNDDDGRRHMQRIGARLTALGVTGWRWLDWPDAPAKDDAADYLAAGGTVAGLDALISAGASSREQHAQREQQHRRKTKRQTVRELLGKTLPPVRWAVKDLIGEGVTLLAAKPKKGKTVLMLNIAWSVAGGTPALGHLDTEQGEVLYIALEDNERRMRRRLDQMLPAGESPPDGFTLDYEWSPLDKGGVGELEEWLDEHPTTRLVVIDTLEHIRPARNRSNGVYADDYASVKGLQRLASERQVAVVVIHHLRKAPAEDPFDEINASNGLLASVDNALVLRSVSGITELARRGRDYEDNSAFALKSDREHLTWTWAGSAEDAQRSRERAAVIEALTAAVPECMSPQDLAAVTKMKDGNVRFLLSKMLTDGEVIRPERGQYTIPTNNANNANKSTETRNGSGPKGAENVSANVSDGVTANNAANNQKPPKSAVQAAFTSDVSDVSGVEVVRGNGRQRALLTLKQLEFQAGEDEARYVNRLTALGVDYHDARSLAQMPSQAAHFVARWNLDAQRTLREEHLH